MSYSAAPSLNISSNILLTVKQILRNADLKPIERCYLANLILDCGKHGLSYAHRPTLAEEVKISVSTARSVERSLKKKGYLCVFEHRGVWYRSPWTAEANRFLASQQAKQETIAVQEPSIEAHAQSMPTDGVLPQDPPVIDSNLPCPEHNPHIAEPSPPAASAGAAQPTYAHAPIKPGAKAPQQIPCNGEPITHRPVDNSLARTPRAGIGKTVTDKSNNKLWKTKSERNPYRKNRHLVKHMVDDIVDTLNIHQSWNWVAKIVWTISEEAEQHLYNTVSWVKDEIHCCRCHSAAGLLTWKLRQEGILPALL